MKQSPFLIIQLWRVVISISGLEGYDSPLLTVIGPMPLILTCYGLIETASSSLICHLAGNSSIWRQTALCHPQPHTLQGAVQDPLPHHSAFSVGWPTPVGCLSVFPQSCCVNGANFSLPWCVGSLEHDYKSRSEHFLVMDRVVKLHCCL